MTVSTYSDEFAENHYFVMSSRNRMKAFVPSAGTGFSLSRKAIDSFGDGQVLPEDSLTEDYRLSLTLHERGINMYYVLERVVRIGYDDKTTWDFIATRSMFPSTFKTAVRQKTRWILGITMQSVKLGDVFKKSKLGFSARYSIYRDLKAKIGNMLVLAGYPILIYFILSLFVPLTPIFPMFTLAWYLSVAVTILMIERQLFRGVAIYKVYGARSAIFSCLLPPLVPFRLAWGNLINLVATVKAHRQHLFGNTREKKNAENKVTMAKKSKKIFAWTKTEHTFLEKNILRRYHRKLGDILLEKGLITIDQLKHALELVKVGRGNIGSILITEGFIGENDLMVALSRIKNIQFIDNPQFDNFNLHQFALEFNRDLLMENLCVPLMKTPVEYVIAFCDESAPNAQTILRETYGITVKSVFMTKSNVLKAICLVYDLSSSGVSGSELRHLITEGAINYEQAFIVQHYANRDKASETEILEKMGLLPPLIKKPLKSTSGTSDDAY